jgi:hypothetical protein
MDRSRRSFIPEAWGAGFEAAGELKDEKSPNPLAAGFCAYVWFAGVDFAVSKKLPPPPNIFEDDCAGGDRVLEKLSRPAKGEGLT